MKTDEDFVVNNFKGVKVLVVGHSGFKGSWLTFTLSLLGAHVYGLSIDKSIAPEHAYNSLKIADLISNPENCWGDVRTTDLSDSILKYRPEYIFYLAAQAIVSVSYKEPFSTFNTNAFGVLNLLESLRLIENPPTTIIVTSDKAYKNDGSGKAYVESDALGGVDPYSASKAAAEVFFSSYLESFRDHFTKSGIATVRAGNVFGGGDSSTNRLIPDCAAQLLNTQFVTIRMPEATRPWTFVHDVLNGYLLLGSRLKSDPGKYTGSWNFASGENRTVYEIVKLFIQYLGYGQIELKSDPGIGKESTLLQIDASKAREELGWTPRLSLESSIEETVGWYRAQFDHNDMQKYSISFLERFLSK
jgi:CDP-glucose 4,6-dehydratase